MSILREINLGREIIPVIFERTLPRSSSSVCFVPRWLKWYATGKAVNFLVGRCGYHKQLSEFCSVAFCSVLIVYEETRDKNEFVVSV